MVCHFANRNQTGGAWSRLLGPTLARAAWHATRCAMRKSSLPLHARWTASCVCSDLVVWQCVDARTAARAGAPFFTTRLGQGGSGSGRELSQHPPQTLRSVGCWGGGYWLPTLWAHWGVGVILPNGPAEIPSSHGLRWGRGHDGGWGNVGGRWRHVGDRWRHVLGLRCDVGGLWCGVVAGRCADDRAGQSQEEQWSHPTGVVVPRWRVVAMPAVWVVPPAAIRQDVANQGDQQQRGGQGFGDGFHKWPPPPRLTQSARNRLTHNQKMGPGSEDRPALHDFCGWRGGAVGGPVGRGTGACAQGKPASLALLLAQRGFDVVQPELGTQLL